MEAEMQMTMEEVYKEIENWSVGRRETFQLDEVPSEVLVWGVNERLKRARPDVQFILGRDGTLLTVECKAP